MQRNARVARVAQDLFAARDADGDYVGAALEAHREHHGRARRVAARTRAANRGVKQSSGTRRKASSRAAAHIR